MTLLNLKLIEDQLFQLASKTICGETIERQEFNIKISLPVQIVEVLKHLAETEGTFTLEDYLAKIATAGLDEYIFKAQEKVIEKPCPAKSSTDEMFAKLGIDKNNPLGQVAPGVTEKLNSLQETLNQFQELASKLSHIESMLSAEELDKENGLVIEKKEE